MLQNSRHLQEFIIYLKKQKEVRIFVDIKTDGTGHAQASLDLANRLRHFGYEGLITFVLGETLFDSNGIYGNSENIRINESWFASKKLFDTLVNKQNNLGDFIIISQDMLHGSNSGIILEKIIKGSTLAKQAEAYDDSDVSLEIDDDSLPYEVDKEWGEHSDLSLEEILGIPNYPDFKKNVNLGFSGAADNSAGELDKATGTACCIALQPTGWEKGQSGIWANGAFYNFKSETIHKPLCSLNSKTVNRDAKAYLDANHEPQLLYLLKSHVRYCEIVVLYNIDAMSTTQSSEQIFKNLQTCFANSKNRVLFIELHSSSIASVSSKLDPQDMRNDSQIIKLKDLEHAALPDLSIIDCDYMPSAIFHYLLKQAVLVVCEGQGTAQKSLLVGTPCLHAPKNSPTSIYASAERLFKESQNEDVRVILEDATWHMTRSAIGTYQAEALYACFHSTMIKGFCTDYSNALSFETDRLAFAINETVVSEKLLEFSSSIEESSSNDDDLKINDKTQNNFY